jgi:hypothetical protein
MYRAVDGHHPALAKLYQGEDVLFPKELRYITARNLRGPSPDDNIEGEDVFLHRLLFESRGRPGSMIWNKNYFKEYTRRSAVSVLHMLPASCE